MSRQQSQVGGRLGQSSRRERAEIRKSDQSVVPYATRRTSLFCVSATLTVFFFGRKGGSCSSEEKGGNAPALRGTRIVVDQDPKKKQIQGPNKYRQKPFNTKAESTCA